jgi:hypothetical protein
MNWDAIGAIGEIAGAPAIFGSLVYLVVQIEGQNIESQATVTNSLSEQWLEFMKGVSGDEKLADIWTRGLSGFFRFGGCREDKVRSDAWTIHANWRVFSQAARDEQT